MMVMCGDTSPVVASICDCTDHMSEGGKKDTTFITEMFQQKVNDFDLNVWNTDVFFFNIQKAGLILCQTFSRVFCFLDGKHVLSLFFSDLS